MIKMPNKSLSEIQKFLMENKMLISKYMIRRVERAIVNNKSAAFMFRFATGDVAAVRSEDFTKVLSEAIQEFIKEEDYEYAAYTRDVLNKWYVEQFIRKTTE